MNYYTVDVSEWLRRSTANRLCFAREGSNPFINVKIHFTSNLKNEFLNIDSITQSHGMSYRVCGVHAMSLRPLYTPTVASSFFKSANGVILSPGQA